MVAASATSNQSPTWGKIGAKWALKKHLNAICFLFHFFLMEEMNCLILSSHSYIYLLHARQKVKFKYTY